MTQTEKVNVETKIRKNLEEATENLARLSFTDSIDNQRLSISIQAYTSYLNYISQERSLKQIKITAIATSLLALGTFILALVTAFHP